MKSKKYLIAGGVAVLLIGAVALDTAGMFKGSLFAGRRAPGALPIARECTKADFTVSPFVDTPSGAVLQTGSSTFIASFVVRTGNCTLSVNKFTGLVVAKGVEINNLKAYHDFHDLDSNFEYVSQPGATICNRSFTLTTANPSLIPQNSSMVFKFRGNVDGILTGRNADGTFKPASLQVKLYGPNALGGVTANGGVLTSGVNSGAGVENICM